MQPEPKTQWNVGDRLLALLVLLWMQSAWQAARAIEPVPYSAFEKALAEGRVAEVAIGETAIVADRVDPGMAEQLPEVGAASSVEFIDERRFHGDHVERIGMARDHVAQHGRRDVGVPLVVAVDVVVDHLAQAWKRPPGQRSISRRVHSSGPASGCLSTLSCTGAGGRPSSGGRSGAPARRRSEAG